jgi:hypothetical protein
MPTKFRDLERMLRADGWTFDRASGSHHIDRGIELLIESLKSEGKSLPESSIELVSIEVAA